LDDLQRYLVEEFVEDYKAGQMARRELVKRISLITGAAVSSSLLTQLGVPEQVAQASTPAPVVTPNVRAQQVEADDPSIRAMRVTFPGTDGASLMGYLARPVADGTYAGVLVMHENRGLTAHIQDVIRRFAKVGFAAMGVDLVSRAGGTEQVTAEDAARVSGYLGSAGPDQLVADLSAGVAHLQSQSFVRGGGIGATGFCFGGGMTWRLAVTNANIVAVAPFYGPNPPLELIPNLAGPVVAFYGGDDARIDAGIPALVTALMGAQKVWSMHVYAGAPHAFHNDTGSSYRPEAAKDAWVKTVALFSSALPQS
jgi:carboxymethylenebutenolidase